MDHYPLPNRIFLYRRSTFNSKVITYLKGKRTRKSHQKAVTEEKSEMVTITQRETTAERNWKRRRTRPPGVPAMPWTSFILTLGALLPPSLSGGASTGCTTGLLTNISSNPIQFTDSEGVCQGDRELLRLWVK